MDFTAVFDDVMAGVILYFICKWFDNRREK